MRHDHGSQFIAEDFQQEIAFLGIKDSASYVREPQGAWVLKALSKDGLVLGGRVGVDASTMEANAARKTIVRRDTGESCRKMLLRLAKESGIDSPKDDDLARMDRKRVGKTLSNKDWRLQVDPKAKITKMKDGRPHFFLNSDKPPRSPIPET